MSVSVTIYDEWDVESIVNNMATKYPATYPKTIMEAYVINQYGITLEQFDKVMKELLKEKIPEDMI